MPVNEDLKDTLIDTIIEFDADACEDITGKDLADTLNAAYHHFFGTEGCPINVAEAEKPA